MANARQFRAALEKEFAKLSKASESVEVRLKSVFRSISDHAVLLMITPVTMDQSRAELGLEDM